ncbi:hypothetical protein [Flavobacterium selenitireducens]|uniref:hypothetical protein n=1 Tax=Flavobacterium selenitireducens TaxID=2722704 RepID=UPI00168C0289|nr:hypothetical protein [Flavobacterium selenitireducens]MBD3583843.1 hypothetical protein [Flavobacterium selenitireducens]
MENPNNWEGRENERLSRYDEGNESNRNDMSQNDYSLSDAENQYATDMRPSNTENPSSEAISDDERYSNSYGSSSDSSRSLLTKGNEMVFGNDHEGQEYDDAWEAAQRDEQTESYEEERRRLERERNSGGFESRL